MRSGPASHLAACGEDRPDLCHRRRPFPVPHLRIGVGDERPNLGETIVHGVDAVCDGQRNDEVVGDDSARCIHSAVGIRQAECYLTASPVARDKFVL